MSPHDLLKHARHLRESANAQLKLAQLLETEAGEIVSEFEATLGKAVAAIDENPNQLNNPALAKAAGVTLPTFRKRHIPALKDAGFTVGQGCDAAWKRK